MPLYLYPQTFGDIHFGSIEATVYYMNSVLT